MRAKSFRLWNYHFAEGAAGATTLAPWVVPASWGRDAPTRAGRSPRYAATLRRAIALLSLESCAGGPWGNYIMFVAL